jgi:hypothetical protein
VNNKVGEEGRNDEQRTGCLTYINLREAAVVCLNYAQPIDVNHAQNIPYPKRTPRSCGDVWAVHCDALRQRQACGECAWCTLEGLRDRLTRNLDCDPRVWEG